MKNEKGQFVKGSSGFTGKHSEVTKEKIRVARARQGSNVWNKGTNNSGMKGKKRTEEWKTEMREKFLGRSRPDLRGELSPNWKGGITPIVNQVRNCFKYRQWRSDVFTRDDYTCQDCGVRGSELNAHHFPKSFSEIFRTNELHSYEDALGCEELWNINNGRTLCVDCHKQTDNFLNRWNKNI